MNSDTELKPQAILNRVFNTDSISITDVGGTSIPETVADTKFTTQQILNRIFENNSLRIIRV